MSLTDVEDIRKEIKEAIAKVPRPKEYSKRKLTRIKKLLIHCTDGFSNVWGTLNYDLSIKNHITPGKPLPGLTYHFFIESNGITQWTMPLEDITWHAGNWNGDSVGLVLQYRATGNEKAPPFIQMQAAYLTAADICLALKIDPSINLKGHRETGAKKSCPGKLVDMNSFRKYVTGIMQKRLKDLGLYEDEIDGLWGKKSKAALEKYVEPTKLTWY